MKSININHITQATRDKWLSAAERCPYATYFHTPYWYDIITPKQKHIALDVSFDDGASAIIPIAKVRRMGGMLIDHFSSPGGTYGGWLSTSTLSGEHIKLLTGVLASYKNLTFRVNPFDENSQSVISLSNTPLSTKRTLTDDFTHILDLTKGADELLHGLTNGHKRAIASAVRGGLSVKPAESSEEWERYYGLYRESLARWRAGGSALKPRTVYPRALFRRVYENRTGNEILWLALKDGEPVAGALFFYWGRHAVGWHGAASARHFRLRPNNLLLWEVMLDAERRGYEIFDFNPSGGYGGVESFKRHFGAVSISAPVISTKTPLRRIIARARKLV
jgi:hypothetical protein